jgi:AraC-like DNA-binding protein
VVRRAALAEEDVFHGLHAVHDALHHGYPRIAVVRHEDWIGTRDPFGFEAKGVPVLALTASSRRVLVHGDVYREWAFVGIDDAAMRLRALMARACRGGDWVEAVFSDLTRVVGENLPPDLRGFFRRVLEFPSHYSLLERTAKAYGLSAGALKARFRRRGLPSPSTYLRWLRVLAAGRILLDPRETVLSASFRLGFASDGNFCRWVSSTSGMSPSALREPSSRSLLLLRTADECFPAGAMEGWRAFRGLFLRSAA